MGSTQHAAQPLPPSLPMGGGYRLSTAGGGCAQWRRNFLATEFFVCHEALRHTRCFHHPRQAVVLEGLVAACLRKAGSVHFIQCHARAGRFGHVWLDNHTRARVCVCVCVCVAVGCRALVAHLA
jgi:hypothetical protein